MLKKFVVYFLIGLGSLTAQTFSPQLINNNLISLNNNKLQSEINILAVMVEFQPDEFTLTKGDGTFGSIYSQDYGNTIIDPLPHDIFYFQDHLEFAKNYYSKVSNDNVELNYTILPNVITVSKVMRDYSPSSDESFKVLADFSEEVWALADDQNSNVDFSQYNLFVIFHAGVGKDISTSDLLGEARDLPSIYLGPSSLKEFYGDTFNGFPTNDGALIPNTLILPETESREEDGFGGTVLLQLSINGLIVSSIASYLGLPDLFDSETGKSAIGRFGLMDGQSLFAYAGLFPPEPSAWEKVFLGWEQPVVVNSNSSDIEIVTKQVALESDAKIIKILINSSEYYLVENRQRDANNDGSTITYKLGGQIKTITFNEDLDNFNSVIIDTLKGVVIDVDEFDWATPGNGILVWHIDEKIITEGLTNNRVNVGDNRGVDLEEADGIQDIGIEFQTIFGDVIIAEGDEFDFWYSGNSSELYTNKFGAETKPNTNSNSGSNSLITFSNFSSKSNRMSFDVNFGNDFIELLSSFELSFYHQSLDGFKLLESDSLLIGLQVDSTNLVIQNVISKETKTIIGFSNVDMGIVETSAETIFIGALENQLNIAIHQDGNIENVSAELNEAASSPISVRHKNDVEIEIYVGLANGKVEKFIFDMQTKELLGLPETISTITYAVEQIAVLDERISTFGENQYYNDEVITFPFNIVKIAVTKNRDGQIIDVVLTENNTVYVIKNGDIEREIILDSPSFIEGFSIGDIKNDGENYIIFNQGDEIKALNIDGSNADNFPYKNSIGRDFSGEPLIADLDNDGMSDVVSTTINGNVFAVSGSDGKVIEGFPISIGGTFFGEQSIVKRENEMLLSSVTDDGEFYFWSINSEGRIDWGSELANNLNNSSLGSAQSSNYISTFFPINRTYNWPNPVYGNETFIRTYVAEDSEVNIKIFDLAGDLVDELEFNASGGVDSEIAWDVSNIQSGAYLAHVEVNAGSKSESKIIKIAVVK